MVVSPLRQAQHFRPNLDAIENFLNTDPAPKAIVLNSPHNPTGGIAHREDLIAIADLIRGRNIAVFCDEPYDQMAWAGKHHSLLAEPGMLEQCVGAYTFSKSFSMSGWRLGFAVSSVAVAEMLAKLTNTMLSCVPPFVQLAGAAALREARDERDSMMAEFRGKIMDLVDRLNKIAGVSCLTPGGSFYAFPCVAEICNREAITSHGLALYLLEGAATDIGVACLGGECFGEAGGGFLRLSCSEPSARIAEGVEFINQSINDSSRIANYLEQHPEHQLSEPYTV